MTQTSTSNSFYLQFCLNKEYIIWEESMLIPNDLN
uniref:Uncharacterized protein n=1 Tax=Lepeophtheirus salmonis TaxID=72036 RepID=A0A0K2TSV6_LEPSM